MSGATEHMVLERAPLSFEPDLLPLIPMVAQPAYLVVREGIEVRRSDLEVVDPSSDCWFAVQIDYPQLRRKDGSRDYDLVVTNGDEYYRARRILGKSPMVCNLDTKSLIDTAVQAFVRSL